MVCMNSSHNTTNTMITMINSITSAWLKRLIPIPMLLALAVPVQPALAQGTAFTYQGRLNDNSTPVNGNFDLTFALFDTNSGGGAVAGPVTNLATLVSNGLFTTTIDFGPSVFTGASNWLQLAVRPFTAKAPARPTVSSPMAYRWGS